MKKAQLLEPQKALRKLATPHKAAQQRRFFKTGPGQYGEGDVFIGVTVPEIRSISKQFKETDFKSIEQILKSEVHEDRLLGLLLLVHKFNTSKTPTHKKEVVDFYLQNKFAINNWDLVDVTVHKILGDYCFEQNNFQILENLSNSSEHWSKRMAMVSTFALIRRSKLDLTFQFAEKFLVEEEDLMHKATGWMLREAGKKDVSKLKEFISRFGAVMPRTMLRYSIEKFPEKERKKILRETKQ